MKTRFHSFGLFILSLLLGGCASYHTEGVSIRGELTHAYLSADNKLLLEGKDRYQVIDLNVEFGKRVRMVSEEVCFTAPKWSNFKRGAPVPAVLRGFSEIGLVTQRPSTYREEQALYENTHPIFKTYPTILYYFSDFSERNRAFVTFELLGIHRAFATDAAMKARYPGEDYPWRKFFVEAPTKQVRTEGKPFIDG